MTNRFRLALVALTLAVAPFAVAPFAVAMAQQAAPDDSLTAAPKKPARTSAPKALPGARIENADAAPLNRPPSEMKPNEALFDAINRGDLASTRDAISRGAELETKNILGLTPVDLAIDLGRNDITFLLLSMRGAAGQSSVRASNAAPAVAGKPAAAAPKPVPRPVSAAPVAPPQPRRVIVNDPGTPAPQAGFLGFGRPQP